MRRTSWLVFAFILGVLPLAIAGGAGAASRKSLGTGVLAGMLAATSVGIFFIPTFFTLIRRVSEPVPQAALVPAPAGAGIKPEIGEVIPMTDAERAIRAMAEGKTHGKTVFTR